jgi:hypothetical protein
MQIINFFLYINTDYPINLEGFFKILGSSNMDFFPNPLEGLTDIGNYDIFQTKASVEAEVGISQEDDEVAKLEKLKKEYKAPKRFEDLDLTSSFIVNAGS